MNLATCRKRPTDIVRPRPKKCRSSWIPRKIASHLRQNQVTPPEKQPPLGRVLTVLQRIFAPVFSKGRSHGFRRQFCGTRLFTAANVLDGTARAHRCYCAIRAFARAGPPPRPRARGV